LGNYNALCGNCRDACALRFTPEGGFLEELVLKNDTLAELASKKDNLADLDVENVSV
jgi:hypothetical protein